MEKGLNASGEFPRKQFSFPFLGDRVWRSLWRKRIERLVSLTHFGQGKVYHNYHKRQSTDNVHESSAGNAWEFENEATMHTNCTLLVPPKAERVSSTQTGQRRIVSLVRNRGQRLSTLWQTLEKSAMRKGDKGRGRRSLLCQIDAVC